MKYINIDNVDLDKRLPKIDFNLDDGAYELACSVFNNCNLHCKFCFQDHSSLKRFDQIRSEMKTIPDILIKFLQDESKKYTINKVHFKMWGGELFYDAIPDDFFDSYYQIYKRLVDSGIAEMHPTWLTNLTYKKTSRVYELVKATNGNLCVSFDPIDRFSTPEEEQLFTKNLKEFSRKDIDKSFSITLARKAINKYIHSSWNDSLKYRTDISYYTPGANWKEDIPDDEDMYNFFRWTIDHQYYFIRPAFDILAAFLGYPVKHYCNCAKAAQYQDGKVFKNCALRADSSIPQSAFYKEFTSKVDETNCAEYKNSLGILKRGCLDCEWYTNCQKPCWVSLIFDGYKISVCPFKRLYRYLDTFDRKDLEFYYNAYLPLWEE
jgi:hypothetical protein